MNQMRGIDEALTCFDGNDLIIGKRRKDRSAKHMPDTNYGMMVAATIGAG